MEVKNMGAKRTEYALVGRYMSGKTVVGYHLQALETGKNGRYTNEQFAYLVGRDQVVNCSGQIYNDTVLYRGTNGTEINALPVMQEDGSISRTNNVGHIRRDDTAQDVMNKLTFIAKIKEGRNTVGYVVQNNGGQQKSVSYNQAYELARSGKIGNARAQVYQGKPIIKGVNCDLNSLPIVNNN